jgi:hypothetical protein
MNEPYIRKRLPFASTFYVPSLKRSAEHEKRLMLAVGGMTVSEASGEYVMTNGDVVRERITKLEFFANDRTDETTAAFRAYIKYLIDSGEESVLVRGTHAAELFFNLPKEQS